MRMKRQMDTQPPIRINFCGGHGQKVRGLQASSDHDISVLKILQTLQLDFASSPRNENLVINLSCTKHFTALFHGEHNIMNKGSNGMNY